MKVVDCHWVSTGGGNGGTINTNDWQIMPISNLLYPGSGPAQRVGREVLVRKFDVDCMFKQTLKGIPAGNVVRAMVFIDHLSLEDSAPDIEEVLLPSWPDVTTSADIPVYSPLLYRQKVDSFDRFEFLFDEYIEIEPSPVTVTWDSTGSYVSNYSEIRHIPFSFSHEFEKPLKLGFPRHTGYNPGSATPSTNIYIAFLAAENRNATFDINKVSYDINTRMFYYDV